MSFVLAVRKRVPKSFKNFLRQRTLPWRISKLLSPYLPVSVCADVGASYFPHEKWLTFLNSPQTQWLAVEPNEANIDYVKKWQWPCKVSACTTGLSREGGMQTLYVTNVDTGSSLLPPVILESMKHRVTNLDYFFPVTERTIETITLKQALANLSESVPVFVKLDTQGTELSILMGAESLFQDRRIVGIEMESTLLAQPFMEGSGKFWQACEFMEAKGFELLHLKPIYASSRSGNVRPHQNTYLNECDAVFALRQDIARDLSVEYRVSLLAFYLTNFFYEEGLSLLERDEEVTNFLNNQGCRVEDLLSTLSSII